MSRRIQAPGIELNEFDRSAYDNKPDNSIVSTVSFICGYANKGEDYTTQWINSKQTLVDTYGYPTNEPEKFFFNAGVEILNRGGILLMSKVPYDNNALGQFNTVTYKLNPDVYDLSSSEYSSLSTLDSSITKFMKFDPNPICGLKTIEELDAFRTGEKLQNLNELVIFDTTRGNYTSTIENTVKEQYSTSYVNMNDCLGIIPIVTTSLNAILLQNRHMLPNINAEHVNVFSTFNPALPNEINCNEISVDMSSLKQFAIPLSSDDLDLETLSKHALAQFADIPFLDADTLDKTNLKSVGIVVYKAYRDSANENLVNFKMLESFVGSLDKSAKDPVTQRSIYIENIVNTTSQYINVFSNFNTNKLKTIDAICINSQIARSLGFYKCQQKKIISYTTINDALNNIFSRNSNKDLVQIDLVVDAGMTTIAQMVADGYLDFTDKPQLSDHSTRLAFNSQADIKKWYIIAKKYDDFCKYTRKDCIFLLDIYRSFCLNGEQKIVRSTKLDSSVMKNIVPKLRYVTGLNSSYSVGYSDWVQVADEYNSELLWLPPSIKSAGIYTYTDTYFHTWDAPAGIRRGKLQNIVDVAYSPTNEEAGKIYSQCWNYAINYPLEGPVLEGQKTMQIQRTAFDRVNVRRLFLHLEKRVIAISKYFTYEGNTEYLRQRFVDTIRPIFEEAVAGGGISQYYIRCDNTNNTPQTIDNNELHCQIVIKPVKTIEFIILDFVCTNQSGDVTETLVRE